VSLQAVTRAGGALATTDVEFAEIAPFASAAPPPVRSAKNELGHMLSAIGPEVRLELDAIWWEAANAPAFAIQRE
jgi:hypothetical protein